ncbi:major capsid protein [Corynebacterium striatum]|uniref:major capsid protein n=1 Tax=Corynebacterium striatum TaxID=43770 RepID=UPI003B59ECDC
MADFTFPLAPSSVNQDGTITTDMFVQEPTRLSKYVADLVQANLIAGQLFTSVAATGGAILYDRLEANAALANQTPGVIAPGGEFPVIGTGNGQPIVDPVVKTGGKYELTREAEKRNDPTLLQRGARRIANTMTKDIDDRAFSVVKGTLAAMEGALKLESAGWASAGKVQASAKTALTGEGKLVDDILSAKMLIEDTNLGYSPNTLILGRKDAKNLKTILGISNWQSILSTLGVTLVETGSKALADGEGLLLERGTIGVIGVEDPISTDSEYIKARQVTEFYTWATLAFGVTDPLSAVLITGLAK